MPTTSIHNNKKSMVAVSKQLIPKMSRLVILYGMGGLSDVGRHAILAALEKESSVESIKVLTRFPELLHETNWNSGCPEPQSYPTDPKVDVIKIDSWDKDNIEQHLADATGVISCLGNRQPGYGHWEAEEGNKALLKVFPKGKRNRVVVLTSVGVEEGGFRVCRCFLRRRRLF